MRWMMIVVVLLASVSCSSDRTNGASSSSSTSATSSTTVAARSSTTVGSGLVPNERACSEPHATVPDDVTPTAIPDVDGDGATDQAFFLNGLTPTGGRRFVILTHAGGRAEANIQSASPVPLSVLVANADQRGPVEILVSDNRTVQLFAYTDCMIKVVRNAQGSPYEFDLGFRGTGTGVGCVDTGSGRKLVGLNVTGEDGGVVHWKRTVINLDGTEARNGASSEGTFTRPADDAAIDLLHTVSCGDRTITRDGVQERPGG